MKIIIEGYDDNEAVELAQRIGYALSDGNDDFIIDNGLIVIRKESNDEEKI